MGKFLLIFQAFSLSEQQVLSTKPSLMTQKRLTRINLHRIEMFCSPSHPPPAGTIEPEISQILGSDSRVLLKRFGLPAINRKLSLLVSSILTIDRTPPQVSDWNKISSCRRER